LDWIYQQFKGTGREVALSEYPELAKGMPKELLKRLVDHLANDNHHYWILQRQKVVGVGPPVWETFVEPTQDGMQRVEYRRRDMIEREGDHFMEWLYDQAEGITRDVNALQYLGRVPSLSKHNLLTVLEDLAQRRRFIEFTGATGFSVMGVSASGPDDGEPIRMTSGGIAFVERKRAKGRQPVSPNAGTQTASGNTYYIAGNNNNLIANSTHSPVNSETRSNPPKPVKGKWRSKLLAIAAVLIVLTAIAFGAPWIAKKPILDFWNQNLWSAIAGTVIGGLVLAIFLWAINGKSES
jgi:hypothetical protein